MVLMFVFWFMISSVSSRGIAVIISVLILMAGIWSLIEGIIFIRARENRDALPLALIAILIALYALFMGIGGIATSIFDLGAEGGIFQSIGFIWIPVSVIVLPVLGIWTITKGIILIKNKENVKLGVTSLIIGGIITIPSLFLLFGLFI